MKSYIYHLVKSWLWRQSGANPSPPIFLITGDLQGIPMVFAPSQCSASLPTPAAQCVSETIPYSPEQGIEARLPATVLHMIRESGRGTGKFTAGEIVWFSRVAGCRRHPARRLCCRDRGVNCDRRRGQLRHDARDQLLLAVVSVGRERTCSACARESRDSSVVNRFRAIRLYGG